MGAFVTGDFVMGDFDPIPSVNSPDWEKIIKLLELHTIAEHGGCTRNQDAWGVSSAPRLEKLPCPSFTLDMSQNGLCPNIHFAGHPPPLRFVQ